MNTQKSMGFTIAELLVTLAIIAVLAAMVVPVFEARSEEARSLTCQSNMQRIVTAIRMYMADHDDTLPPTEHRQEAIDYFNTGPGGRAWTRSTDCYRVRQANPYLRWPVILGSYVASRSLWQCPSATIVSGAAWIIPGPDWLGHLQAYEGMWGTGTGGGPCYLAWPTGWGGTVTDSITQQQLAMAWMAPLYGTVASGAFVQSIGTTWWPELTLGEVADASTFIIAADGGVVTYDLGVEVMAYPDICQLGCSNPCCSGTDWEICADSAADCGLFRSAPNNGSFLKNVSLRTPYARHRGRFISSVPMWERNGVNVGFLDGHVNWVSSEGLIGQVRDGQVDGVVAWGPNSDDDWSGGYLTDNGWLIY